MTTTETETTPAVRLVDYLEHRSEGIPAHVAIAWARAVRSDPADEDWTAPDGRPLTVTVTTETDDDSCLSDMSGRFTNKLPAGRPGVDYVDRHPADPRRNTYGDHRELRYFVPAFSTRERLADRRADETRHAAYVGAIRDMHNAMASALDDRFVVVTVTATDPASGLESTESLGGVPDTVACVHDTARDLIGQTVARFSALSPVNP